MSEVTLTPQQLSVAGYLVRWPTSSCRDVVDYLRAFTIDDADPRIAEAYLAVAPSRMADTIGASVHTIRTAMRRLTEMRVIERKRPPAGSAPPVWAINGDPTQWLVEWRIERRLALATIAYMVCRAPYDARQLEIYRAPHSARQTGAPAPFPRLVIVQRGEFVARAGARDNGDGSRAVYGARQIAAFDGAPSSLLVPSEPSSKQQEKSIDLAPGIKAVLGAFYDVTGHPAYDGKHMVKTRIVEAVTPLADTGFVVADLHRMGRPTWMAALARIEHLAAQGAPAPAPRSGPTEFVSQDVQGRPDPAAAAAALEAARSVLRPGAKWEDAG